MKMMRWVEEAVPPTVLPVMKGVPVWEVTGPIACSERAEQAGVQLTAAAMMVIREKRDQAAAAHSRATTISEARAAMGMSKYIINPSLSCFYENEGKLNWSIKKL
jgi:hypothetical protein